MRRCIQTLLAAALVLLGGNFCEAADQIDNPEYTHWAKFHPGTTVTHSMVSDRAGNKDVMQTTRTLVSIVADKAVIETKITMTVDGQSVNLPAQTTDVPAKMDKPAVTRPKPDVKESTEDVTLAGKTFKCKVMEATTDENGTKTVTKAWTSDDVPYNGLVKSNTTIDDATKVTITTTLTAITIK